MAVWSLFSTNQSPVFAPDATTLLLVYDVSNIFPGDSWIHRFRQLIVGISRRVFTLLDDAVLPDKRLKHAHKLTQSSTEPFESQLLISMAFSRHRGGKIFCGNNQPNPLPRAASSASRPRCHRLHLLLLIARAQHRARRNLLPTRTFHFTTQPPSPILLHTTQLKSAAFMVLTAPESLPPHPR